MYNGPTEISPLDQLKGYAAVVLDEASAPGDIRQAVHDLHSLFVHIGALNAYDTAATDKTYTAHGFAIAPQGAAMCVFEHARTAIYVRGLKAAIEDILKTTPDRPVNILYAGCGPYALLAVLAAPYFTPAQVQFSLLELHSVALNSAKVLIAALGLQAHFCDYYLGDAIQFVWPAGKPMNILLTETMTAALKNEAQVAITLNLAPQLAPDGVLLPQEVNVTAALSHNGYCTDLMMGKTPRTLAGQPVYTLAHLLCIDKPTATAHKNELYPFARVTAHIPPNMDWDGYVLELQTTIKVYGRHQLLKNDCSLTLPRQIKTTIPNTSCALNFVYNNGPQTGFNWEFVSDNAE